MPSMPWAVSRAASCIRSRLAWTARTPEVLRLSNSRRSPLCRNDLIRVRRYYVAHHTTIGRKPRDSRVPAAGTANRCVRPPPLRGPQANPKPAPGPKHGPARPYGPPDGSALCPVDRACDAQPRTEKPRGRGAVPRAGPGEPSPSGFFAPRAGRGGPVYGAKSRVRGARSGVGAAKNGDAEAWDPTRGASTASCGRPWRDTSRRSPARPMVARAGARDPMHGRRSDARRPSARRPRPPRRPPACTQVVHAPPQ